MKLDLVEIYKKMVLIRECEVLIQKEYRNDLIKTPVHLSIGAEAIPCGILPFFKERRIFGTYRNHHWYLETTADVRGFFLELLGKQSAPCQGRAGSMHLCDPAKGMILSSAVVATTLPIAMGDCWAGKCMNQTAQTIVFFGDGAIEEGVFWETLNFCRLKNIPLLMVCEDNSLAIHAAKKDRQSFEISSIVDDFKIPYYHTNAYDVENVMDVTRSAIDKLKAGPVFMHLEYFRAFEHVGISEDFQFNYRAKPDNWNTDLDPLWVGRKKLVKAGVLESTISQWQLEIIANVESIYRDCLTEKNSDPAHVDKFLYRGGL